MSSTSTATSSPSSTLSLSSHPGLPFRCYHHLFLRGFAFPSTSGGGWRNLNLSVAASSTSRGSQSQRIDRVSYSCRNFSRRFVSAAPNGRAFTSSLQPSKATSDDSGRAVTGESILLNEQTLERELEIAIDQENYAEAAKIRDRIRILHEDRAASLLAANAKFYNAFRLGDLASMQNLWAKGDSVCCVHPGASGISGYDLVMRSWEYVWVDYEFPLEIELRDVQVHVTGDLGYVTCVEMVKTKGSSWGRQFATNIFERVDGQWLICVHHASPIDL